MDFLLWMAGVFLFLLILMVSVGLHEGGHMIAAKKLGISVPEFFVGFGRKIFSFKRGETEYGLRSLPLGGYVRLVDNENTKEDHEGPERELLSYVAPWKRQIIYFAGPLVNIVLGLAILFSALVIYPYNEVVPTVNTVNSCSEQEVACGALAADIRSGDKITAIDGTAVKGAEDIAPLLKGKSEATIDVLRGDEKLQFADVTVTDNRFGVMLATEEFYRTPGEAIEATGNLVKMSTEAVLNIPSKIPGLVATIFTGAERDPNSPGSVVGAGRTYGDVAATNTIDLDAKIRTFVMIAGGLNLSLGIINLLPVPPLDGGRMLFAFIDSIRLRFSKMSKKNYTPTPYKYIKIATLIPAILLVSVMALLIVADIVAPVKIF